MDVKLKNKSAEELLLIVLEKMREISTQKKELKSQNKQLSEKDKLILQLEAELEKLKEQLKLSRYKKFGKKSEKLNNKEDSFFDEPKKKKYTNSKKKTSGRKAIPDNLPREEVIYTEESPCKCGAHLTAIGNDTLEQLDIVPMKIYVKKHIRIKYVCRSCNSKIVTAKMPKQPIPKSIAAPGLLSHIIVLKYQDHLPFYRQEVILQRFGISLPRATLCNWILKVAELLKPMYDLMQKNIIQYDVAYSDETTLQVLREGDRKSQSTSYMWLFAGGGNKFCYIYKYNKSRSHNVPLELFKDFSGYLHCDGFSGYDALANKADVKLVGCWYHFRRKLIEVENAAKKGGIASTLLDKIRKLAKIESDSKNFSSIEKKEIRFEKSTPIIEEIKKIIDDNVDKSPPNSLLYNALNYAINQWQKLIIFLQDGRLDISNNLSERAIKPFVMGRKAWLFSNSIEGANASSIIYSFIETCKHHSIEPYFWFKYVLENIHNQNDISSLLPFNIDKTLLDNINNYDSS